MKQAPDGEGTAPALEPTEVLRLCDRLLTEDQQSFILPRSQAKALAFLARWKIRSLQAVWHNNPDHFKQQWNNALTRGEVTDP